MDEAPTMPTNLLTDTARKILDRFVEAQNSSMPNRESGRNAYGHIDIAISRKKRNEYSVRLTYYGPYLAASILPLTEYIFRGSPSTGTRDPSLAIVRWKCKDDGREIVYDVRSVQGRPFLSILAGPKEELCSSFFKEYLSFEPKIGINGREKSVFVETLLGHVVSRQKTNANVKFVCRLDDKIIYNNRVPLDEDYASCQILTSGLTAVLKQSLSIEFRGSCFSRLKVNHSHGAEAALMVKLLPMINDNYAALKDSANGFED